MNKLKILSLNYKIKKKSYDLFLRLTYILIKNYEKK